MTPIEDWNSALLRRAALLVLTPFLLALGALWVFERWRYGHWDPQYCEIWKEWWTAFRATRPAYIDAIEVKMKQRNVQ